MGRLCFLTNPWGSGEIRGRQIAKALGPEVAVVNPTEVHTDDVVIGIKVLPPDKVIDHVRDVYIDVVDCHGTLPLFSTHKKLKAIAIGDTAYDYLCREVSPERVVKIPEHNCNFERIIMPTNFPIKTVGYIGEARAFHLTIALVGNMLYKMGIDFITCFQFSNRQHVVDFYSKIDMQLAFRMDSEDTNVKPELKNPLKLVNAGSFGIPTISCPEISYIAEWKGCFWEAKSMDDVADIVRNMTMESYQSMAYRAIVRAEYYHIERILPLYMELLEK